MWPLPPPPHYFKDFIGQCYPYMYLGFHLTIETLTFNYVHLIFGSLYETGIIAFALQTFFCLWDLGIYIWVPFSRKSKTIWSAFMEQWHCICDYNVWWSIQYTSLHRLYLLVIIGQLPQFWDCIAICSRD